MVEDLETNRGEAETLVTPTSLLSVDRPRIWGRASARPRSAEFRISGAYKQLVSYVRGA